MRHLVLAAITLTSMLASLPPRAEAQSAEALLSSGVRARARGHDEEALSLFRRAYEIDASPRALAQIALAEQALGSWADAESHLDEALRRRSDRWIHRNERVLEEALEEIRSHLGELVVGCNLAEAELAIDGRVIAALPLVEPLHLPVGRVEIEVRATGYAPVQRLVEIRAGERSRETVHLEPEATASEQPDRAAEGRDATAAIALLVVGGVATVTAIGGVIWWIDRQSELDFCDSASCTNRGELESVRNAAIGLTLGALAVGAGLGVLGFVLLPDGEDASASLACGAGIARVGCRVEF